MTQDRRTLKYSFKSIVLIMNIATAHVRMEHRFPNLRKRILEGA
jgi:hypothetical protein